MTEICTSYPEKRSNKPVGPKDPYHEPYPGYWDKEAKKQPVKENKDYKKNQG